MRINGSITFRYQSSADAKVIFDSLEADNENYLKSDLNDDSIEYKIKSEKLGSFLATVDDLIASEIVCEKIISKTSQ